MAIVLFFGLFGWKITILYLISAILLGTTAGMILAKMNLEKYVADYVWKIKSKKSTKLKEQKKFKKLIKDFWQESWNITKKITPYVLIGIGIGALLHGYIPTNFFEKHITADNLLAVPLATILAVPLYANAVSVIPIMRSLIEKGIPFGTALAFMMAVIGLSLPAAMILKKVMKLKLLIYFFSITTINIILIGYLFNIIIK